MTIEQALNRIRALRASMAADYPVPPRIAEKGESAVTDWRNKNAEKYDALLIAEKAIKAISKLEQANDIISGLIKDIIE